MSSEPSVLIIGAGVFGASTAYHLARSYKQPGNIAVLDRSLSPVSEGASTDINKIIRDDYPTQFYCDLAHEAIEAWTTWPELKPFYHRTGRVMLGQQGSDLTSKIRATLRKANRDDTEDISLDQIDHRWKGALQGSVTEGFDDAYWNPHAGWCDAADATAAIMKAAIACGVHCIVGEVIEMKHDRQGQVHVHTRDGSILHADQIVLATGAWTSKIMSSLEDSLDIADNDRVERQATAAGVVVAHYKMSADEMDMLSEMPVVVYGLYGEIIPPPRQNQLLKYANAMAFTNATTTTSGHKISVPPETDQHIVPKALQDETMQNMMSKIMPAFAKDRPVEYWRLCWDSITPTQDWVLAKHPDPRLHNLYLAIGGSFHSYKFLPSVGKYMVNVLSGDGNGAERDERWAWKTGTIGWKGAHEKTAPKRDLSSFE